MTFPVVGSNIPTTYQISNSLRFNDDDSPYLSWTPSTSPDNSDKFTISVWLKLGNIGVNNEKIYDTGGGDDNNRFALQFQGTSHRLMTSNNSGVSMITSPLLRDPSAWYHIVAQIDSQNATVNDRHIIYINGTRAELDTNNLSSINQVGALTNGVAQYIGRNGASNTVNFDGYMAEFHMIDGLIKSPTDFAEADEDSGVWKPKQYAGTYGTNGFYLKFNNTGNMGEDSSGNDNTWTPTNLSGTTDVTTDTPTNNFATLNPLNVDSSGNWSFSEGNCKFQATTGDWVGTSSTQGINTGKWYAEFKMTTLTTSACVGIASTTWTASGGVNDYPQTTSGNRYSRYLTGVSDANEGKIFDATGSLVSYGSNTGASTGDIISVAMDLDNNKVYWATNGTWENSANPATNTNGFSINADTYQFILHGYQATSEANFGNPSFSISSGNSDENGYGNFEYAPPSGYLALCTQNLATALSPTIDDGSQYFNTVLYSGNSSVRSITGVGFQPDWTWIKSRSNASWHALQDSSRGSLKTLFSNQTDTEVTYTDSVTSFDSDGFSMGDDSEGGSINVSSRTYVAWNWNANGGTTSSNTDGSITSTVQANTTAGFSIVTYTGTGSDGSVGHGLGVAPKCYMIKARTRPDSWIVGHTALGTSTYPYNLLLNQTSGKEGGSYDDYLTADPTSTVLNLGNAGNVNGSGDTYVAYCFAEIEGYSKFGSYTGNGSTDGTFVYTGFRPAFVIYKRSDAVENWQVLDVKRDIDNPVGQQLYPNLSASEGTENRLDFVSNGFKFRNGGTICNASGGTYIYMAFAENPFVTSGATPVTAR